MYEYINSLSLYIYNNILSLISYHVIFSYHFKNDMKYVNIVLKRLNYNLIIQYEQ